MLRTGSYRGFLLAGLLTAAMAMPVCQAQGPRGGGGQGGFDDHQNMMDQLGIKALRPGADANDPSIYDESKQNQYADTLPDALTMKDGTKVTNAEQWAKRRAEIVKDFEDEVYGHIPDNVPKVNWEVTTETRSVVAGVPVITRVLAGHVDNSAYPDIDVTIQANFTVPVNATKPVPVMMEFGGFFGFGGRGGARGGMRGGPGGFGGFGGPRGGFGGPGGPGGAAPSGPGPWTQQAIEHGWGYGYINPGSIQPDNNQLRSGIIGLTNKGEPRKPDQWGALRAWQWGVSRLIDFYEAHPEYKVDPAKVGIEGVSRYGKAALVTEAFDPRVAVALVASSGEGGAALHRHIFGERVENLTGGEYYWMAGNFIKYGASDPKKTVADLPVDSHELIALCAPRPCFISYGVPSGGDPNWVDAPGAFQATVLASKVYELLGKKGLGTPGDYLTDPMPPVNTLIGGDLAWRQHDGGHTATPNWPAFFEWVGKYIPAPPVEKEAAAASSQ